eukprot:202089-Lingulodinium_polyedra.AAC.1
MDQVVHGVLGAAKEDQAVIIKGVYPALTASIRCIPSLGLKNTLRVAVAQLAPIMEVTQQEQKVVVVIEAATAIGALQPADPIAARSDAWAGLRTALTACKGMNVNVDVKNEELTRQIQQFIEEQLTAIESITSISDSEFKPYMLQTMQDLLSIIHGDSLPDKAVIIDVAMHAMKVFTAHADFTALGDTLEDM